MALRARLGGRTTQLEVVDVGCGAGTQARVWAQNGHRVTGVDISGPLIDLARQRADAEGTAARYMVGSAECLDLPDGSVDVVLLSELLEHVPRWQPCIDEAVRVLRPGGLLFLSTTNVLCPKQHEFALPLYSWYPARLKRRCERLSVTSHPHWVQHTSLPAVHWFSFYQLRDYLKPRGLRALDRFDLMDTRQSTLKRIVVALVSAVPPLRWLAHVASSANVVVGYKLA